MVETLSRNTRRGDVIWKKVFSLLLSFNHESIFVICTFQFVITPNFFILNCKFWRYLIQDMASAADSCMTPPSCPVSLTWPSDLEVDILLASTTIVSPPTLVQASPTATPATPRRPASSDSNLGCPRTSSISFKSIIYRLNLDPVVFFF